MALGSSALHHRRWRLFSLFAAIQVMSWTGGTYVFAGYSEPIKALFGYDQKALSILSSFKNLGANLGVFAGFLNELSPPWVMLLCSAAMNVAGYLMVYLSVSGHTARPPLWLMCGYITLGAMSQSFDSSAALVTTVKNFPDNRGGVIGLLVGFAGLSGAMFTHLNRVFHNAGDDAARLVLLVALIPAIISVLSVPFLCVIPQNDHAARPACREQKVLFFHLLGNSCILGLYLLVLNVIELSVSGFPRPVYYVTAVGLLLILVIPSLIIVFNTSEVPTTTPAASASSSSSNKTAFRDDYSIPQALCSVDMLLLSVTTMCGIGGTMTAIDNIGQIGQSLGYPEERVSMLVSLVSLANYAGRVVGGFGSEYLVSPHEVPRPLALTVTQLLAFVGHAIVASGVRNGLYVASPIMGLCLGAQWTVLFAVVSELFGLKHFSTLYNLSAIPSALGSYILTVQVTGRLYNQAVVPAHPQDLLTCIGVHCFRKSFVIIAGVTLLGVLASVLLVWRTWAYYRYGAAATTTSTADTSIRGHVPAGLIRR